MENKWEVSELGYHVVRGGQGTDYPSESVATCMSKEWAKKIAKALNQMEADK